MLMMMIIIIIINHVAPPNTHTHTTHPPSCVHNVWWSLTQALSSPWFCASLRACLSSKRRRRRRTKKSVSIAIQFIFHRAQDGIYCECRRFCDLLCFCAHTSAHTHSHTNTIWIYRSNRTFVSYTTYANACIYRNIMVVPLSVNWQNAELNNGLRAVTVWKW